MPISFACAVSHAPGMTAWADAAPPAQKDRIYGGFERLRRELDASGTQVLVLLTSEHWANFFLDHIGAFCVGRADSYRGPVEPWLKIEKCEIKGDPGLAAELIEAARSSEPRGAQLTELYLERCYRLVDEDYAAMADLDSRIDQLRSAGG